MRLNCSVTNWRPEKLSERTKEWKNEGFRRERRIYRAMHIRRPNRPQGMSEWTNQSINHFNQSIISINHFNRSWSTNGCKVECKIASKSWDAYKKITTNEITPLHDLAVHPRQVKFFFNFKNCIQPNALKHLKTPQTQALKPQKNLK